MALQKKFIVTDSTNLTDALAYTQSIVFDESRKSIWARNKQGTMIQYSSYAYSVELGDKIDKLTNQLNGTSYQFTVTGNPAGSTAYITHTGTTTDGVTTYTMNVSGVVGAVGAVDSYAHTVGADLVTLSGQVVKTVEVATDSSSYLVANKSGNIVTLSAAQGLKDAVGQVATWQGDGKGSISYQITYAVDTLVGGAPETFDTLKEIADWIKTDEEGAAALTESVAKNTADIATLKGSGEGSVAKSITDAIEALDGTATGNGAGVAISVSETNGKLDSNATVTVTGATVAYTAPSGDNPGNLSVTANSGNVLVSDAISAIKEYVDYKAQNAVNTIAEHTADATNLGTYVAVTTENGSVKTVDVVVTPGEFANSTANGVAQADGKAGLATVADVATAVNTYVGAALANYDMSFTYVAAGSYISVTPSQGTTANDITYTVAANTATLTTSGTTLTGGQGLATADDVATNVTSYVTNVIGSLDSTYNYSDSDDKKFVTVSGTIDIADGKVTNNSTNTVTVNYGDLAVSETSNAANPFVSTNNGIAYTDDVAAALNDYFSWGVI